MEMIVKLIIDIVAGALAGNGVAAAVKNADMGTAGNSIAGAIGGLGGGWILTALMPGADAAAAAGGLDIGGIITQIIGSGVGGAVLTAVVGMIKNSMQKA